MKTKYRIDQFAIGSVLTIADVVGMERVTLENVTNSAAYINIGGAKVTVSCATECYQYEGEIESKDEKRRN